jgi:hypothetical protein
VAKFSAKEKLTLAEADLEAADKTAKAKMRLAEGIQAEEAAHGLAEARVKEADAMATEKQGMAEVRVKEAEAAVIEKQGLAQATVLKERGLAEAHAAREKLLAEAAGEKEKGLARASIGEAEAQSIQKRGEAEAVSAREKLLAEAKGIEEKLLAEARGLAEKAESMKLLQGATREHEEFRLRLQKERDVELASIHVRKDIAEAQSKVLSETMGHAKINIVGGDGQFFERFIKAISVGQSVDGALDQSETLRKAFAGYLNGDKDLAADLKEILSKPGLTSDAQNLAMAALLHRMAPSPTTTAAANLKSLVESEPVARALAPEKTQG